VKVSLHPSAQRDLDTIFEHYGQEGGMALALRFVDEFERVARLLVSQPGLGVPCGGDRRVHGLRTFPYAVVYRPQRDGIRVLVIRHRRRHPDYGMRRR
jgi:plasmid stabilization system protein ParE